MLTTLRPALVLLAILTIVTGGVYPAAITAIAQLLFSRQANGSLLREGERVVGSEWIGQSFTRPEYLWGRLSATGGSPYDATASSGSNLGQSHPALLTAVERRVAELRQGNSQKDGGSAKLVDRPIPVDLVTSSASGLDPHISPAAAEFQTPRIAAARRMEESEVQRIIARHTEPRWLGLLGEPRVHVLRVNLELDRLTASL